MIDGKFIILVSDAAERPQVRLALNGSEFLGASLPPAGSPGETAAPSYTHLRALDGLWFIEDPAVDAATEDTVGHAVPVIEWQPAVPGTVKMLVPAGKPLVAQVRRRASTEAVEAPAATTPVRRDALPLDIPAGDHRLGPVGPANGDLEVATAADDPSAAAAVLRRWVPVLVLGVMLLVLAAHAALSARSVRDVANLRSELQARTGESAQSNALLLDALRDEIRTRSEADRVVLLQELSGAMHAQVERQASQTADQLLERLARARTSVATAEPPRSSPTISPSSPATERPSSAAPGAPHDPAAPAATPHPDMPRLPTPSVLFFVDASSPEIARSMPRVFAELSRELGQLEPREEVRLLLLEHDELVEAPAELLPELRAVPSRWGEFLTSRAPERIEAIGDCTVAQGLQLALRHAPKQLFILADGLDGDTDGQGGGERRSLRRLLLELNGNGETRIHVIHFFDRGARGDLTALAREQGGSYSFVPAMQP